MKLVATLNGPRRKLTRSVASGALAIALATGCGAEERPAVKDWTEKWNEVRLLVPTAQEFTDGGGPYCDRLLGQLRTELPALTPTPSESIDPALNAWSDQLRTLAFECPSNPSVISHELSKLHDFESQIAAVLP